MSILTLLWNIFKCYKNNRYPVTHSEMFVFSFIKHAASHAKHSGGDYVTAGFHSLPPPTVPTRGRHRDTRQVVHLLMARHNRVASDFAEFLQRETEHPICNSMA